MIFYISEKNFKDKKLSDHPNIEMHFKKHKELLTKSKIKYKTPNKPYFYLHRERIEDFFMSGEKIAISTRIFRTEFMYTKEEFYASRALNIIKTNRLNMKYLCGILNSYLIEFWLKNKGKRLGNMLQIDKEPLLEIPLVKPNNDLEEKIVLKVNQILTLKKENPKADTTALEKEIDQMVYKLYGLTEEEISIVENS